MIVLITGIDGYIGTILGQVLIKRGHDIVGLDTGFYKEKWLYDSHRKTPPVIIKDVRNTTLDDLKGIEAVVHMAELSNDPLALHSKENTYKINYEGSVNFAKLCKKAGVKRFIYTSSCSIYGKTNTEFVTEKSPTNPQTIYAKCKVMVETQLSKLASKNFSPVILRNATAFGPSPRMRFDLVLNNLAGWAWTTKEIRLESDGTAWRPLIHVADIAEAIAFTLEAPLKLIHNEIFNIGNNSGNYQVSQLANIVASVFPGSRVTYGNSGADTRSYRVSFDKINTIFPGFASKRNAKTGVKELYKLYKKINLTREMFEFRGYTRLKQLNYLLKTKKLDKKLFWKQP